MGEVSRSDRGADRQTRAPATPHAVRFYGFKGAKGVWVGVDKRNVCPENARVFPHSLLQIFCRFDFFDRLRAAYQSGFYFLVRASYAVFSEAAGAFHVAVLAVAAFLF